MEKKYKEPNKSEIETTINVLYEENLISIYTNKVNLQKQLYRILGEPKKEYIKRNFIIASVWEISLEEKSKITQIMLKADIFELK